MDEHPLLVYNGQHPKFATQRLTGIWARQPANRLRNVQETFKPETETSETEAGRRDASTWPRDRGTETDATSLLAAAGERQ